MLKQTFLAACLVWLPLNVYGQVPLLWDIQEDLNGGYDLARAITLSGRAAVVVGNGGEPKEGTDDFDLVIQALGRATGAVRWSDQTFLSSGSIEPLFVSSRQNRAFAVGTLHEPGDLRSAFLVRAYDVSDGSLLWENLWHPGDGVDSDHPTAIVAGPTQVVVMGYGQNRAEVGLSVLVRAYDPETGDVLWENRGHRDGFDLVAFTIAANRNRVFIAGRTAPAGEASGHDLFLHAYDAATGALAWETTRASVATLKLTLASGRLVVAGGSSNSSYLAAFSAKSGRLLWEDAAPITGMFTDVAVKGSLLVGAVQSGSGYAVRVHDVATGQLQWQDRPTIAPGFRQQILAVGLNNDAVYAAGTAGQDLGNSEFLVRAYDAHDGTLLWDDRSHPSSQTAAVDLQLGKSRLFVAGYTFDSETSSDFLIRGYDIRFDATDAN